LGLRPISRSPYGPPATDGGMTLAVARLPTVVRWLTSDGWLVEAEGKLFRRPGRFSMSVTTGIDWFDLRAAADFDGEAVALPRLLAAIARGEDTVVLDDGTVGLLPEEWIARYRRVAGFGTATGEA